MEDFDEIEEKFRRTPVRLTDYGSTAGVLRLNGRKSILHASSDEPLDPDPSDENGWYDIRLRAADGRELLLHHAITLSSASHGWGGGRLDAHSAEIFPNVVVDDLRGLSGEGQVQRIQFRLRGLQSFFHYQHAEALRGYEPTLEQLETLRAMRYEPKRDGDVFAPREIYVVHAYPEFFSFRVENRTYQVWAGGKFSGGNWDRIDARVYPIASIAFDRPVDIEAALDRAWEWRRFFAQMALLPLPFQGISVQGSLEERARTANLYLPNLKRRPRKALGPFSLSPRYLALNFWADRERLAEAMRTWLSKAEERRGFRANLDHVIERIDRRIDPSDLVDLGAAVDSLAELSARETLPNGALDAMIDAAHAAASASDLAIERDRISGLLGSLQRPSLSMRFARLGAHVSPSVSTEDAELLARSASRIRNASAHGGALDEQIQPRVSPTVQALAALCARFDLESCGIPSRSAADARTMTKVRFDDGLDQLRALERRL